MGREGGRGSHQVTRTFVLNTVAHRKSTSIQLSWAVTKMYCQNPNSTISSIQQSLSLDYILTQRSTPAIHQPTTNSLLLLLTAPASKAGRLHNCTVTHIPVQPLCTTFLRPNFIFFQTKGFGFFDFCFLIIQK
jgi:hypothetical protein